MSRTNIAPGDLRAWLEVIEREKALIRVKGADWNQEIGTLSEINTQRDEPAALLFEEIRDYPTGRVLTAATSSARTLGITLGIEAQTNQELVRALRGGRMTKWFEEARQNTFLWAESGPVATHIDRGDQVNLERFPTPFWHADDGGRYIGTGCAVITQDPETGAYNAGAYRAMLVNRREMTVHMASPSRHGYQHRQKYQARGEKCPIVVSLGHDPLFAVLSGLEVPEGVFELDVAGAIAGRPVRMLKGEVTGLPVPADADLVIEGWLTAREAIEGPFGEFTGYYAGGQRPCPVIEVEAVYYRDNPIILGSPPGRPPHDFSYSFSVLRSALIHDQLERAGIPDVSAVWADEVGSGRLLITVAIKQRYMGHSRQAGFVASQCQAGAYFGRYVIVVDDDIDPTNLKEVVWAMATRSDPASDVEIIRKSWGSRLDPLYCTYAPGTMYNSRAIIDACRPFEYLATFPRVVASPPEDLERVRKKWQDLWK